MNKKAYIQISLSVIILFIIIFIYFDYFKNKNKNKKISKLEPEITSENIIKSSDDLIKEMVYFSEDNQGNRYEIKSEYGVINPDKSNLIIMNNVTAVVYLIDGERIFISSNKAEYNDENNDTTFSGSVEMNHNEHQVNAENLELSFEKQIAFLYNKVIYKSSLSNLFADKIIIDFLNRRTKIQMDDENNNVLIRSILNNGNN
tara:strand:+ start:282 stop:887 length:606 start_codon:yes stop_codon:yes gene_type:complete